METTRGIRKVIVDAFADGFKVAENADRAIVLCDCDRCEFGLEIFSDGTARRIGGRPAATRRKMAVREMRGILELDPEVDELSD